MNKAYIAHIVADSKNGPRGDDVRSEKLKNSLSNLMLLCDECHRRIDIEDVDGHPEALLIKMKEEHEDRIKMLTDISPELKTQIFTLTANFGKSKPSIARSEIVEVVVPARCPSPNFLAIDLTTNVRSDDESDYWDQIRTEVERQVDRLLPPNASHVSVFGIAPIPILIVFGRCLGDIRNVDVFQKFREGHPWKWKKDGAQPIETIPPTTETETDEVAIALSFSGEVSPAEVGRAIHVPVYNLGIKDPGLDAVVTLEMLSDFRSQWRSLLASLRDKKCLHVFPAVPNSIAIEMGRCVLPKADPKLVLWDYQRGASRYVRTLTL